MATIATLPLRLAYQPAISSLSSPWQVVTTARPGYRRARDGPSGKVTTRAPMPISMPLTACSSSDAGTSLVLDHSGPPWIAETAESAPVVHWVDIDRVLGNAVAPGAMTGGHPVLGWVRRLRARATRSLTSWTDRQSVVAGK